MKYIIKYTNQYTNEVTYIEVDSMVEFAVKYLDFDVIQNERGGWDVLLLGKEVAHYTNEWTRAEVLKDYFRDFERKNNWKNIEYYTKI
jgi:hypothetical protein